MHFLCNNCNINRNVNILKNQLENTIVNNYDKLHSKDIVKLSQILDKYIYKCEFCRQYLTYSKNSITKELTLKSDKSYLNLNFIISLFYYIFEGLKKNEIIYLSVNSKLYNDIIEIGKCIKFPIENLKFRSITEPILWHVIGGLPLLEENIRKLGEQKEAYKYTGFRWISQVRFAVDNTSMNDFYNWEMNLSHALDEVNPNNRLSYVFKRSNFTATISNEPVINYSLGIQTNELDKYTIKGLEFIY